VYLCSTMQLFFPQVLVWLTAALCQHLCFCPFVGQYVYENKLVPRALTLSLAACTMVTLSPFNPVDPKLKLECSILFFAPLVFFLHGTSLFTQALKNCQILEKFIFIFSGWSNINFSRFCKVTEKNI